MSGYQYYDSGLKSAHSKAVVLNKFEDLSDNICGHLVKALTIADKKAQHHWLAEVNAWLGLLARMDVKCKCNITKAQKFNKLNQYDKGLYIWMDVLDYCNHPNNKSRTALVYDSYIDACANIPDILDEFAGNTEAFLHTGRVESLASFKSALKELKNSSVREVSAQGLIQNKRV